MKKILATLLVLAIAVPAFAEDITFTADGSAGDGTVTISYTSTVAPRGIALSIDTGDAGVTVSSGAVGYFAAEFNCFIDQANEQGETYALGTGTPLADPTAAGLPDFPASEFSVCMGALDMSGTQAAGPPSATLLTIQLDGIAAGSCQMITIDEDSFRGGVVGDAVLTTNLPITVEVCVDGTIECIASDHPDYAEWVKVGKPTSWCGDGYQCYGDADNTNNGFGPIIGNDYKFHSRVSTEDVNILISGYRQPYSGDPLVDTWISADFDRTDNGYGPIIGGDYKFHARVSTEDVNILINNYRNTDLSPDCNQ